jgi:hypothetical protein
MFGTVGLGNLRKVTFIEKFRILGNEEFRDFYMSSGFSMEEEYRRLRLAGYVVRKLRL